jgi:transposase
MLYKDFHPGKHGGLRRFKFTTEEKVHIEAILWNHAKQHPLARLGEYKRQLLENGYDVSLSEISKIFKSWHWSFKKPHRSMYIFKKTTKQ